MIRQHKKIAVELIQNPLKSYEKVVAVSIKTTSQDLFKGDITCISLAGEDMEISTEDISEVKDTLNDGSVLKVFHNGAIDICWLKVKGYDVEAYTDTMIMGQVVHNSAFGDYRLKDLAKEFLGIKLNKGLKGRHVDQRDAMEGQKRECLRAAIVTYKLYLCLAEEVERLNLQTVLRREIDSLKVVIELKVNGIAFDYKGWKVELDNMKSERRIIEDELRTLLNDNGLNLRSSNQLLEAFKRSGIEVESTADEVLAKYRDDHEVVKLVRRFRKLEKRIASYGEKLKGFIGLDGRIRGNWKLIGSDTFRMSCERPNLQGMPGEVKRYFHPRKGYSFVVADYSNIELRVLAEVTKDKELIKAFDNGEDLHNKTARAVLDKDPAEKVNKRERKIGKVVNFGLVYGMTDFGLEKKINSLDFEKIGPAEAERFRSRYFDAYKGVREYQDRMLRSSFVETLSGRYWDGNSKEFRENPRRKFNYPIQASSAEGMKEALIMLMVRKPKDWLLVAAVHDEVVLEVPEQDAEEAEIFLVDVMKSGMEKVLKRVPVEVEVTTSDYWAK